MTPKRWYIYDANGDAIVDSDYNDVYAKKLEYHGEFMGESYVAVTIESSAPINFNIGDNLVYRGETYTLNYVPTVTKRARRGSHGGAFVYEQIKFDSASVELTDCRFLDYVLNDNEIHYSSLPKFSFYCETVKDLTDRILANLNRLYTGERAWTITYDTYADESEKPISVDSDDANVVVDGMNCWDALALVNTQFGYRFTIKGRNIRINYSGDFVNSEDFAYGRSNGLISIQRVSDASQQIITRLRAYGSTKNLPYHYYANIGELKNVTVQSIQYAYDSEGEHIKIFKLSLPYSESYFPALSNGVSISPIRFRIAGNHIISCYYYQNGNPTYGVQEPNTWYYKSSSRLDFITEGAVVDKIYSGVDIVALHNVDNGRYVDYFLPNNMAVQNLMLPGFPSQSLASIYGSDPEDTHIYSTNPHDPYIDSERVEEFGVREGTIFFDGSSDETPEICPTIKGMQSSDLENTPYASTSTGALDVIVSAEQIADDGVPNDEGNIDVQSFKVRIKDIGFDINDYLLSSSPAISFTSGMCTGREFEITRVDKVQEGAEINYELTLNRVIDNDLDLFFPYKYYNIKAGDTFVLLNIAMPDAYVEAASERLRLAAIAWLAENDYPRYTFALNLDPKFMQEQHDRAITLGTESAHDTIKEGQILVFEDDDLQLSDGIFIDKLTIKEGEEMIPLYEVTLNQEKTATLIQRLQNKIDGISNGTVKVSGAGGGISTSVLQSMVDRELLNTGSKLFLSKVTDDVAQGNINFAQNISVTGTASIEGELSVTGTSDFDGDEEHRGAEVHYGHETHNGEESHTNNETHTGDEEHGGNVSITKNLSIDEGAIAEILGTMFFGRGDGFVSGLNGNGGKIDSEASAELKDLFVRELTTIVRGIFNELVSSHPTSKVGEWFQQGFNGHGTKIWYDQDTGWNMELDTLTVRRIMYIFELVIQKIRSVGGILIVSAANGKIKEVQKVCRYANGANQYYYKIKFEDTNTFVRHDLMRCQRWNNGRYDDVTKDDDAELPDARAMQYYWVEVAYPDSAAFNYPPLDTPEDFIVCDDSWTPIQEGGNLVDAEVSNAYDILVPRSEFGKTVEVVDPTTQETIILPADTEPQVGDDCVLMGNTQYTKRQNYIYISATEDGVPRIDVMDSCNSKGDGGNLRCRLGCLDGINDSYWGLEQPSGYGLYSDNAWLKGKFIVRIGDKDRDVSTMFEVLDGMIRSSVSSLREDTIGGEGCISNNVFTDGLDKWGITGGGQLLTDGTDFLRDSSKMLTYIGLTTYVKLIDDNGTFAVEMKGATNNPRGIIQKHADMHDVPTFEENSNQEPIARAFAVSFYAKADTTTPVVVGIGGVEFTIMVSASNKFKKYVHTLDLTSVGDFTMSTEGKVQVRGIVVSVDLDEAMIDRVVSRIEQIPDSIRGIVEAFTQNPTTGAYELTQFTEFQATYNSWQTTVYDVFVNNTNSKFTQLSDSITSSVNALVPISENDYIYDPSFSGGLDYITKWNLAVESSSKRLVVGTSGGEKYFDILNNSAETPVGFFPALKNTTHGEGVSSKATEICLSARCMSSATIVVRQDTGDGNTEEIYRKSLTPSLTYELVRFNAPWKFGNIYIGVLGVNAQVYISSACMADDGKAVMVELSSRITQTQNNITATVQAEVSSATETIEAKVTTLELTADGISARVDANSGNRIFSRLTSDFDYYDVDCSFEPEDISEYIFEHTTNDKKSLCIKGEEGSDYSEWTTVKLGLLPTAKEYDNEKITIVIKAFAELQASGRIRIRYGSESDDYVDVTNAFSQPIGSDGLYEVTAEINTFNYNYGIKIGVWGDGVLDIYSIVGLVEARSSIISQTSESILSAVASTYVSSSSLSDLVSAYLTANGYATNNDISTAIAASGMMTTSTFNSIFSGYYTYNEQTGQYEYNIAAAISTSVKYTVVDGQKIMQGDVAISASNIHLEGYTTINNGFSVDEDGNATMNDCTVAGVINNLAQVINADNAYKYFAWDRTETPSVLYLDATKVSGAVILDSRNAVTPVGENLIPNFGNNFSGKQIWLPSVYMGSLGQGVRIAYHAGDNIDDGAEVDTVAGSPISMKSMRMLIGKKLTLYLDGDRQASSSRSTINCALMKYGENDWGSVDNITLGSGYCLVAECKMIQINNHEAIGWEITEYGSMMLFDSDFE